MDALVQGIPPLGGGGGLGLSPHIPEPILTFDNNVKYSLYRVIF